ncbi:hypothetical protein FRC12_004063 [Ceratobasidium sp. 428]|nr:hypothetical protein FRC12_004063 [Ceratobasidium sp. 428]
MHLNKPIPIRLGLDRNPYFHCIANGGIFCKICPQTKGEPIQPDALGAHLASADHERYKDPKEHAVHLPAILLPASNNTPTPQTTTSITEPAVPSSPSLSDLPPLPPSPLPRRPLSLTPDSSTPSLPPHDPTWGQPRPKAGPKALRRSKLYRSIKRSYIKSKEVVTALIGIGLEFIHKGTALTIRRATSPTFPREELVALAGEHNIFADPLNPGERITVLNLNDRIRRWKGKFDDNDTLLPIHRSIDNKELKERGFLYLTTGTTYGFLTVDGERKLVLVVRFWSWKKMAADLLAEFQFYASWLANSVRNGHASHVKYNKAHAGGDCEGDMWAAGWRTAMDKGYTYGICPDHTPVPWDVIQAGMLRVAKLFKTCWSTIAPVSCQEAADFVRENKLPEFGTIRKDEETGLDIPACNLTWSNNNFSNCLHVDTDAGTATAGIWLTSKDDGTLLDDDEAELAAHKGGGFFWGEFGIVADFGANAGPAFLMWIGKDHWHATARSTSVPGITRWGSSIQVTKKIFDGVHRVAAGLGKKVNDADARGPAKRRRIEKEAKAKAKAMAEDEQEDVD